VERLDPLSQAMLEHRSDVMKNQIQAHLDTCTRPEDVISAVVQDNFTSFYMTHMCSEMIDLSVKPSNASMEKLAEEYVLTLFHKQRVTNASRLHGVQLGGEWGCGADDDAAMPAPWMSGPQVWFKPNYPD